MSTRTFLPCLQRSVLTKRNVVRLIERTRAWSGLPFFYILLMCGTTTSNVSAEPLRETNRFADWEVICDVENPSSCKIAQRLAVRGTKEIVFSVTILPGEGPKASPVAVVSVPLGGYLVPGIEFHVDNNKPYKLLIETCTSAGCHAGFALSGRIDKELRNGKFASFRVWTAKNKPADIDVSLNGLAAALKRLEHRS